MSYDFPHAILHSYSPSFKCTSDLRHFPEFLCGARELTQRIQKALPYTFPSLPFPSSPPTCLSLYVLIKTGAGPKPQFVCPVSSLLVLRRLKHHCRAHASTTSYALDGASLSKIERSLSMRWVGCIHDVDCVVWLIGKKGKVERQSRVQNVKKKRRNKYNAIIIITLDLLDVVLDAVCRVRFLPSKREHC